MTPNAVPLLAIVLLNLVIGSYVLSQKRKALPNRTFAAFAYSVAFWTLGIALTHNSQLAPAFFARATFASATLMTFTLFLLFRAFPQESTLRPDWAFWTFGLSASALVPLSFSGFIVTTAQLDANVLRVSYGPLHRIYALYVLSCFGMSLLTLARKYRRSEGLVRLQLQYLFLGLIVPGVGVTVTNLVIPLFFRISHIGQYGPYFALLFLASTAHALIHYRFMDTKLVLKQGITFLLALLASVVVLIGCLVALWVFVPFDIGATDVLLLIAASTLMGVLLPLLRRSFSKLLDRYVYRPDTNYQRALRDASRDLIAILDLDNLLTYAATTLFRTVRAERVAIYLADLDGFRLCRQHVEPTGPRASAPLQLLDASHIPPFFVANTEPLVTDEVTTRFPSVTGNALHDELRHHRWALVLPIHTENRLRGLIALGPKLSGDPFFPDEIGFLSILTNQAGVAVRNAQLYQQVILANEYVENILSTMDSGVLTVDANGRIALCNSTAEALMSLTKSQLVGLTLRTLPPSLADALHSTLSDGRPRRQTEHTLVLDKGRRVPIVCSTSALRDDRGNVVGALAVFSDLTQIKALESEKRRAERLAAFGALVSGIAHEIKNPLVAIRTFAELLPDRFSESDFREEFAKVVVREIDRIDDLVARLRGLAVPSQPQATAVDIRAPLLETLALLRGQIEQTHTTVRREFLDAAPLVGVDPSQLKQLFLNVLLNAIEAMRSGGELIVNVSRRQAEDGPWIAVTVTDTGPGIPDAIRTRVFEPFFTTKPQGSGLGLAICRGIVDAHRGTIRAERNQSGAGATIVVEFPAASQSPTLSKEDLVSRSLPKVV